MTARQAQPLLALLAILSIAASLRFWNLGRQSFWYDEVVTIRLARTTNPFAMLRLLDRIDATRAPLHPLLLQAWVVVFGPSEFSARSLSALFGLATILVIYCLGHRMGGRDTGLWAAWLAAVCPPLVQYSREARMYALLVLLATLAWDVWFAVVATGSRGKMAAFALVVVAMIYAHPLGLLMAAALATATLVVQLGASPKLDGTGSVAGTRATPGVGRETPGETETALVIRARPSLRSWCLTSLVIVAAVAPWLGRYFDHDPESTVGRLPVRFLLGLPIGFVGGDSRVLAVCLAIIALGAVRNPRRVGATIPFVFWLVIPPVLLYLYSLAAKPIFGPARYTLFVAPAYLLLLGRGLARLPAWPRWLIAPVMAGLSALLLMRSVYVPDLKADWKSASREIFETSRRIGGGRPKVVVLSADPSRNVEVETARYYLGPGVDVLTESEASGLLESGPTDSLRTLWIAVGVRGDEFAAPIPKAPRWRGLFRAEYMYDGLRLEWWRANEYGR